MKTLKEVYKNSFLIGNIYTPIWLENEPLQQLMRDQVNVITAENIMKPALIQPEQGKFCWDFADDMIRYAEENGFKVVGHTLAWHQQTLNWINEAETSKEKALELLGVHMKKIMTRYKGKIMAWDVVNEAIEDGVEEDTKEWRKHLRHTPWLRMIGEDYIHQVFHMAHELDPNAILYYNDYNLNDQQKREATYYMVKELKEAGVPIHGIGMQGHYHTNTPIDTIKDSLALFSKLEDVEISITELDVTVTGSEKSDVLSIEHEIEQAQYYAQLFQIYKAYKNIIKRITFWGTDDATSWRRERFPTIFNKDYAPKMSYDAIINPDKFLADYPLVERDTTQTAIAIYGTPELGKAKTWNKSAPISVSRQLTAWEGATAKSYAMWDKKNLYLLAEVAVSSLHATADKIFNKDSVAFYFKGEVILEITITFENEVKLSGNNQIAGFESSTTVIDEGYQVFIKVPLTENLTTDQIIGYEMQVNDANVDGVRQSIATWNRLTGATPQKATDFGRLKLVKHS